MQPKTQDLNDMVAVASGTAGQIALWAGLLRAAAIPNHTAHATNQPAAGRAGYAELWVFAGAADEARSAIRSRDVPGARLIW